MPTRLTAADILPHLTKWQARYEALRTQMEALAAPFGGTLDGPLFDAVWRLWDAYTEEIGSRLGDAQFWLTWYCDENEMGKRGHEVQSIGGRTMRVRTLRQLARLIEEGQEA